MYQIEGWKLMKTTKINNLHENEQINAVHVRFKGSFFTGSFFTEFIFTGSVFTENIFNK
jgi:hypothetical protein